MLKNEKSKALSKKFMEYIPGGHSNLRVPMDVTNYRLFIEKAKGSHLYDVDGNEYIEYNGALGPNILGYAMPEWTEKLKDYLDNAGTSIGSNLLFSPCDVEVAEMLRNYIPCCEQVKFAITGTDAVQVAFRIMRGYKKRPVIVRFEGHYAGWVDDVLGGRANPDPNAKPYTDFGTEGLPDDYPYATLGRKQTAGEEVFMLPWNDFERLEDTFEKYHDEIAGIHLEGIVANHEMLYPKPGWLEKIRELCDKYDVVMSMDEVISGLRVGIGGVQEYLGVIPDICTMGKAISNGFPVSCVCGKKKIMQVVENGVLTPGTYRGWAFGQCAVKATLDILTKDDCACYKRREPIQEKLVAGLDEIAKRRDIPMTITEAPGMFSTLFGIPGGRQTLYINEQLAEFKPKRVETFQKYLQEQGIFLMFGGRLYLSMAHTMEDIDKTLEAADVAMKKMHDNDYKYIAD